MLWRCWLPSPHNRSPAKSSCAQRKNHSSFLLCSSSSLSLTFELLRPLSSERRLSLAFVILSEGERPPPFCHPERKRRTPPTLIPSNSAPRHSPVLSS